MDTGALKSFGVWARSALIREVGARVAAVLAPASPERVEQPRGVAALEKAIGAAGGGEVGRAAVVDRVAYTWFNRLVALRFMDANGYTGIGVVSPRSDSASVGQPEILAEAKRGVIDSEVVSSAAGEAVSGLLNGTRRSLEPQAEAYGLLLAEYCRYWNRFMPFMFERAGDFTELLMPANLLADDSVLNRAVEVLTEDVCQDVEVIGWLYQFYIAERKDEVFAGFKKNKKAGAEEIPAATQLFTPHWIVRYLVENSLGRLWMLNHPNSRLVDQMDYYIVPIGEQSGFSEIDGPEQLTVLDPACGSGHMLTYAFDLLYAIYEEEGYAPSDIPELILRHNLFGIEIDPRAGALAAFALTMKARAKQRTFFAKQVDPNICVLEPIRFTAQELDFLVISNSKQTVEFDFWNQFEAAEMFGSLIEPDLESLARMRQELVRLNSSGDLFSVDFSDRIRRVIHQADYLASRYKIVVANPPYMGGGNMHPQLAEFAKLHYPQSKADLFAMFIERCRSLACPGGLIGMITMQSWMFLSTYGTLRRGLLIEDGIVTMAHLGSGAFDDVSGEVVATTAFVFRAGGLLTIVGDYIRLVEGDGQAKEKRFLQAKNDLRCGFRFRQAPDYFEPIVGMPVAYWVGESTVDSYRTRDGLVGELTRSEGKNVTTNNARFARFHWEVERSKIGAFDRKWLPCAFGGEPRRWAGNIIHVIDWSPSSREYYRKAPAGRIIREEFWGLTGVTWSKIGTGPAGFRVLNADEMYQEVAVLQDSWSDTLFLSALLNSAVSRHYLSFLSPTMNYQLEDIKSIPVIGRSKIEEDLRTQAERAVEIASQDWKESERSLEYDAHPLIKLSGRSSRRLTDLISDLQATWQARAVEMGSLESKLDDLLIHAYGLSAEVSTGGQAGEPTLNCNAAYTHPGVVTDVAAMRLVRDSVISLVSYAVGCMFGRFSLDVPGLILANQGATLGDFFKKIPAPAYTPDADNVVPIVDGDWFEDDVVARFRQFLRAAFGEKHFEENLRFIADVLEVKDLRDYFVKAFYKDHVQRFRKRPIYWLFSSPKGSFNALIYMHRYNSSTVSTVLNEYLREFKAKLQSSLQLQDRLAAGDVSARQQAAAVKEGDRIRKVLLELNEYEDEVLYPLASRQIEIDLDDGVKLNYAKFGAALKKIPGLEAAE
jgi:hypothetical protein